MRNSSVYTTYTISGAKHWTGTALFLAFRDFSSKHSFLALLIASAVYAALWRILRIGLLFVGFLYDFTKSFAST